MNIFTKNGLWVFVVLLSLGIGYSTPASAVAYCALRDPVKSIYGLFPEADAYRSNVQTVGRSARDAVIEELPFKLHFNELGRHTLYVALKDQETIGFVHARSELGEWGITEYAWGIDPDGRIADVRVQRSRDPYVRKANIENLRALVRGRNLEELKAELLRFDNKPLEKGVISSAMKTLVITRVVWEEETTKAKAAGIARSIDANAHTLKIIDQLYDPETQDRLDKVGMPDSPAFQRAENTGFRVDDEKGRMIGLLIRTPFDMDEPKRSLWWYVSNGGEIIGVVDDRTLKTDQAFASAIGYAPESLHDCSSLADLAALEISTLFRRQSNG